MVKVKEVEAVEEEDVEAKRITFEAKEAIEDLGKEVRVKVEEIKR